MPVHQLLGGAVRDKIRVYAHAMAQGHEELVEAARDAMRRGFTAVKTCPFEAVRFVENVSFVDRVVSRIAALRDGVGKDVDIGIDFHWRVGPAMAVKLARALEPYQPMFIEEPCLPENVDAMATIARSTTIPIATGERLFTKWAFREVLQKQAAAILQPDLSHAGGIFEVRKIAAMAESHYATLAPHCPLGPISLAAGLQVDACTPNFLCQEQVSLGEGYIKNPFVVSAGHVEVPTGPGLGIEVDEEAVAEKLYDGAWENPRFWHEDGSLADW